MSEHEPPNTTPGFWTLLKEDYNTHERDLSMPGFRALAVYRFGVWRMTLRPRIVRMPFSFLYKRLYRFVRNNYSIELPYEATVGRRLHIGHQGTIVVHPAARLGDDCLIRHGVTIGAHSQQRPNLVPTIGDRVQIGAGAMILGGITVGDDARIGANAVVTSDVPAQAKAVTDSATIIRPAESGDS